ncbi:hypothetical protein RJ641_018287 [Dillenia turbinata]|uniref:Uncharacterized protein n=1 Tax=Dillenia turbinata TaxID=194707 RepID=A0AAN8YYA2_9MAGN
MSKAEMYLPSKSNPNFPWFDHILADIGDHQSLGQNLSTFSGHRSRVCKILEVVSREIHWSSLMKLGVEPIPQKVWLFLPASCSI